MGEKTRYIAYAAVIAALYAALTLLSAAMGLASGAIQLRLSEALTVLPVFTPAAVPGLFVGCALANFLTGAPLWDVAFGSLATLLGAALTRKFRKKPALAPLFPILSNAAIVPLVLMQVYGAKESYFYLLATVSAGEIICCGLLGQVVLKSVARSGIFKKEPN